MKWKSIAKIEVLLKYGLLSSDYFNTMCPIGTVGLCKWVAKIEISYKVGAKIGDKLYSLRMWTQSYNNPFWQWLTLRGLDAKIQHYMSKGYGIMWSQT
jgi:hypothetical protein